MSEIDKNSEIIDIEPLDETVAEELGAGIKSPVVKRSWSVPLFAGVAMLSAVAGGWLYRDVFSGYLPSDQIQSLAKHTDELDASVKTLNSKVEAVVSFTDEMKSQITAAQSAAAAIPALQSQSTESKSKIADLQTALSAASAAVDDLKKQISTGVVTSSTGADAGLVARVDAIEKDVASLKQSGGNTTDATILSQSLADLKAKIAAGVAYQDEIDRVKLMVPAADGLETLQRFSAGGLPNAQGLAGEVKALVLALPQAAEAPSGADTSWWGYFSAMAGDLIKIKSAGIVDWTLVVSDCATFADQGDLAGALNKLETLEGALPVELQQWKERAASRLSQEEALEKVAGAVLRQIAAKG